MTLNHDEAIARVTVDGLAVACFNGQNTWDLAFLRLREDTCHNLILHIEGRDPRYLDETVGTVSFETVDGHFPSGFPDGFFDHGPITNRKRQPRPGPETENFRWVIDLENDNDVPHGFNGLKEPPLRVGLTRTFIQNAVFYTLNVSPQHLILVPDHEDPNPPAPSPPRLGKTNDEIAADMFCNPGGEVVIKIDGEEIFREKHRPGNPWKICLTNLCISTPDTERPFRKGDFQHFYEVIDVRGPQYALWGEPIASTLAQCNPGAGPGVVVDASGRSAVAIGRPDCDTTRLGTTQTLDPLFEQQ